MPSDAADVTYPGWEQLNSAASATNAMQYAFAQLMAGVWTAALVQVTSVSEVDPVAPVGFCSVNPLVHQTDGGGGNVTPHGVINNLPYFRLQGGASAVIIDPEPLDIGVAVFASRDISSVKASKGPSVPGSLRQNDAADGLYLGGFLNGMPTQYIQFLTAGGGINIVSPTAVTVTAPEVTVNASTGATVNTPEANVNASTSATITSPQVNLGGTGGKKVVLDGDPVSGGVVHATSTNTLAK